MGGCGADDVTNCIKKGNVTFVQLYRIWKNKNIRIKTKLKIFNSNVKAILLYGCETLFYYILTWIHCKLILFKTEFG
jgi:hypothetical protein